MPRMATGWLEHDFDHATRVTDAEWSVEGTAMPLGCASSQPVMSCKSARLEVGQSFIVPSPAARTLGRHMHAVEACPRKHLGSQRQPNRVLHGSWRRALLHAQSA